MRQVLVDRARRKLADKRGAGVAPASLDGCDVAFSANPEDLVALNDFTQSDTNFRDNIIASRAEKGRRLGLRNTRLRIHTPGAETEERTLNGIAEVKDALASHFGIALPVGEKLDAALHRIIGEHSG